MPLEPTELVPERKTATVVPLWNPLITAGIKVIALGVVGFQ
jgi:hypothetical protein